MAAHPLPPVTPAPRRRGPGVPALLRAALLVAAALAGAPLAACDLGSHTPTDGGAIPTTAESGTCAKTCHGAEGSPAPPRDTTGHRDTSARGVGAHRQHLAASPWRKAIACTACHVVPAQINSPGHFDGKVDLVFREPTGAASTATWQVADQTCTNTYCHGATLTNQLTSSDPPATAGGAVTAPVWNRVDGAQSQCDSCHGSPPPAPHPASNGEDCSLCHSGMKPGKPGPDSFLYPESHIDGHVDAAGGGSCDGCHGEPGTGRDWPPKAAYPPFTSDPADVGVGAHAAHMTTGSTWHKDVTCDQCHVRPQGVNDVGHLDGARPADLTWGSLAASKGTPTWDRVACSNTYCHGGGTTGINGGAHSQPVWTRVDGTQRTCDSCHGMGPTGNTPLGTPHPADTDCGKCHPTVAPGDNTRIIAPAQHIDGVVQTISDQACTSCHGDAANPSPNAPPKDTHGGTTTDARGVGAHQLHLATSTWRKDIACAECHPVPAAVFTTTHPDTTVEVALGPTATAQGRLAATAAWSGASLTCGATYCHGAGGELTPGRPAGGTSHDPIWTVVTGAQSQCDSCHGAPPPPPHPPEPDPANPNCGACHPTMTAGAGLAITDPARHIDGKVDVAGAQACNACHGAASSPDGAPPRDNAGNTATTARGVGAHQAHLVASGRARPLACAECHRVPGSVDAIGHNDTPLPAEVVMTGVAGAGATWSGGASCTNTYCHGATLRDPAAPAASVGGTTTAPLWTKVDGSQRACTSCHGNPPPSPHPQGAAIANCESCHTDMASPTTFSNPLQHVDGAVQVNTDKPCNFCHGGANNAPPKDTLGNTATTARGVGAHQAHLTTGSTWHKDVTCAGCHAPVTAVTQAGHNDHPLPATLAFTGVGAGTTFDGNACASYCHGATLRSGTSPAGGTATAPVWTRVDGTQSQCTSCHGAPPPAPHPASTGTDCQGCHAPVAGPGLTIAMPALHIDGVLQASSVHPAGYAAVAKHGYDFDNKGAATCAAAGCHGAALTGGSSGGPSCSQAGCHTTAAGKTWRNDCTFCHGAAGSAGGTGAPPAGLFGATSPADKTVGAHAVHVTANPNVHVAWDCTTCHLEPTDALQTGHVDGAQATAQAELLFSSLNPAGTFAFATATCTNLYCHGNGQTSAGTGVWTSTTALTCVSCHGGDANGRAGMTTLHRDHHLGYTCQECHKGMVGATATTIADVTKHFDGTKTIGFLAAGFTWAATNKRCSGACHGKNHNNLRW